ncbi:MAG: hypothetical protein U0271_06980 [Polyangiaceae bacterium]
MGFNDADGRWLMLGGFSPIPIVAVAVIAAGVALVGVGSSAVENTVTAVSTVQRRPRSELKDAADGPVIVAGTAGGMTLTAPFGQSVVAYHAILQNTVSSGKSSQTETVCEISEVGGVTLSAGGRTVALGLTHLDVIEDTTLSSQRAGKVMVLGDIQRGPPPSNWSRKECPLPRNGTLELKQVAVLRDAPIVVSGCLRGDAIVPCGDGADFILAQCAGGACADAGSGARVLTRELSSLVVNWATGFLAVGGLLISIAAFGCLRSQRKLDRRRRIVA